MLGRSVMLSAGWPTPLTYRSSNITANSGIVNAPAGVAVGDLLLIVTGLGSDPTIGGFTKNSSATERLFYRIADITDVGAASYASSDPNTYSLIVAFSNGGLTINSASVRSSANAGPSVTSMPIPGFAPGAGGKPRTVIAAMSSNYAGNAPTAPSGFVSRVTSGAVPASAFADMTQGYSGQSVAFTGLTSGGSNTNSGWLVEVL